MKKSKIIKIAIIVSSILLVSFAVFGVTQAYYSSTAYSPVKNNYSTGILSIEAVNKTESISLTDALPMDDEDALAEEPYIFSIKNIGNVDYQFDIKLLATNGENTIDSSYIKVKIDDGEVGVLADYTDSKIMEDVVLKAGETMDIKLWTWLSKNDPATPNSEIGKTFTSQIVADGKAIYTSPQVGEAITAAEYITNIYINANKQEVENNGITYHTARRVGLMNDRLGGTTENIDGGNIRYYGANPNNYVWLGDYYTEDMIIEGNITEDGYESKEACIEDGNSIAYCTEDIEVHAGDKKLWRIIGVFDGKLKLVTDNIISTQGLSWDTSAYNVYNYGINSGNGVNEWSQSDLMKLLNPGYENNTDYDKNNNKITINNSLYWTKGSGTVYTNAKNVTTDNVSFASTGLSDSEKNMIEETIWYTGAYNDYSYANVHYEAERQNMGKMCTSGQYCTDTVTRTSEWTGKVGLISVSDYGYGVDLNSCSNKLNNYSADECLLNNWLANKSNCWTMSPFADWDDDRAYYVFSLGYGNQTLRKSAGLALMVRPSVYLKSGVSISSGSGSESDPYVLSN